MSTTVYCPRPDCRHPITIAPDQLGRSVHCPHCNHEFPARGSSDTPRLSGSTPEPAGSAGPAAGLPAQVGRFCIRARVGAGAFATVYRAYDPQLDREVALKVPHPGSLDDPTSRARFLREARAAANLRHPHIVPVFEAGAQDPDVYLASGLVRGATLASVSQEGPMDFRRAANIVRVLAEALAYAHDQGVVHRDVKPANVLLDEHGQPQLLDFGLAFRLGVEVRLTQEGALLGTPVYMAPEQIGGMGAEAASPASDQYSLGVVLYELLAGRAPFEGPTEAVLYQALHQEAPPLRRVRAGVPADLEMVCRKAMARRAEERYASCRDLADDLRRWLEGEPIRVRRAGWLERALKWVQRRPTQAALVATVLCLAAGAGAAGLWYQHDRARLAVEQAGRDRDEPLRRGQLEGGAAAAAREAEALRERALKLTDDPPQWEASLAAARAAARQAEALLVSAGEAADPDLTERVRALLEDLKADEQDRALVAHIDHLRAEQGHASQQGQTFQRRESFAELRRALEEYGLRVSDAGQARVLLGRRPGPVREKLVAALDFCLANAARQDAGVRAWLLTVLDRIDPDSWRLRVRRAAAVEDWPTVLRLLREPEASRQPAAFLALVAVDFPLQNTDEKIDLLRQTQGRYPADFWANHDLAVALLQRVIRNPWDHVATANELPRVEEAIGFYRAALAVRPDSSDIYNDLGLALHVKQDHDGAVAAYRKAIALDPKLIGAHNNLGIVLVRMGRQDDAIAAYRAEIALNPKAEYAYTNLGNALLAKGLLDDAIAAYHTSLSLGPWPPVYGSLGAVLLKKGQWAEARASTAKCLELLPANDPLREPFTQLLRLCERGQALDAKLPALLKGEAKPADAAERIDLAQLCQEHKALYVASARFYTEAFALEPKLAADLDHHHRYNAACAAALAADGQGKDAAKLDAKEKTRQRRQALDWLRADLAAYAKLAAGNDDKQTQAMEQSLAHWQQDPDLASVRDKNALDRLPEQERSEWRKLWADWDALLQNVRKKK
jgi:serine/threonine-protein kinase